MPDLCLMCTGIWRAHPGQIWLPDLVLIWNRDLNAIWCAYLGQFWHSDLVLISNGDWVVISKSDLNQILNMSGLNFKQNYAAARSFIIKNTKLPMRFQIASISSAEATARFFLPPFLSLAPSNQWTITLLYCFCWRSHASDANS